MSNQLLDPTDLPPGQELPRYISGMRQWSRGGLHPAEEETSFALIGNQTATPWLSSSYPSYCIYSVSSVNYVFLYVSNVNIVSHRCTRIRVVILEVPGSVLGPMNGWPV